LDIKNFSEMKNPVPELEMIKLDEILSKPSEKEVYNSKTPRNGNFNQTKIKSKVFHFSIQPKDEISFIYTLKCIYLPLLSQVTKEDTFDSVLDPQEIINIVLKAFPEFKNEFESIWNEIIENSTTNLIDYPMVALKEREYNLNSGMLPFYR
jgi:hypothetical protein